MYPYYAKVRVKILFSSQHEIYLLTFWISGFAPTGKITIPDCSPASIKSNPPRNLPLRLNQWNSVVRYALSLLFVGDLLSFSNLRIVDGSSRIPLHSCEPESSCGRRVTLLILPRVQLVQRCSKSLTGTLISMSTCSLFPWSRVRRLTRRDSVSLPCLARSSKYTNNSVFSRWSLHHNRRRYTHSILICFKILCANYAQVISPPLDVVSRVVPLTV